MALIPTNTNTTEFRIEHEKLIRPNPRTYLGMSGLGHKCLRYQWYSWRWSNITKLTARINRLFNRGHLEESSIIPDLKSIGIEVFRRDGEDKIEMTGDIEEEQEEIVGFHQHCMGHPDGRVLGVIEAPKTEHLLEMKTMNDKYYTMLKEIHGKYQNNSEGNSKALKDSFGTYYAQMVRYMGAMKLKRGLFVATNKNDSARKYMRIQFDKKLFNELVEREEEIITSEKPPPKKFKAEYYLCQWCSKYQICHLGATPSMNCRTCVNGDIEPKGKWSCGLTGKKLSKRKQLKGCEKHKRLF